MSVIEGEGSSTGDPKKAIAAATRRMLRTGDSEQLHNVVGHFVETGVLTEQTALRTVRGAASKNIRQARAIVQ